MLDVISQYYDNPVNKRIMDDATVSRHEWNSVCGDDITVQLKLKENAIGEVIIEEWSYDGNTSMITTAASSFFSELIIGKNIDEVLLMTYENTLLPEWFQVTPRRKRAWAIAILATRNALHIYLEDGKMDSWDDVVDI